MRNECNIIRDILPLYAEDMVSDDTVSFVEEHLQTCAECSAMYERIKEGGIVMKNENKSTEQEIVNTLKKLRKKVFKRFCIIFLAICIGVVGLLATLQVFPVYRFFQYSSKDDFVNENKIMLAYIGTPGDRKIATDIVNYASIYVFSDISHTYEENLELYGELGRYPFDLHYFDETRGDRKALYETHSIELLSAHIDENHGYIFVEHSQQAIGENGEAVAGHGEILSLWEIEKDADENWKVISTREGP